MKIIIYQLIIMSELKETYYFSINILIKRNDFHTLKTKIENTILLMW